MNVLVLYVGGIQFNGATDPAALKNQLQTYLELQLVAKIDIEILSNTPGADITWPISSTISRRIHDVYQQYDGFVVIHGLDHAVHTANAVAFQLTHLGKPVIFTGTPLPEEFYMLTDHFKVGDLQMYREMSLRTSLVTAVQLATLDCSGVILAYGPKIIQATRAIEQANEYQTFTSWRAQDIATVRFGIELNPTAPKRSAEPVSLQTAFDPMVYILPHSIAPYLPADVTKTHHGIVLTAYNEQLVPSTIEFPTSIPTFVLSASQLMQLPGKQFITVPPMTPVAGLTKAMTALARFETNEDRQAWLNKNIAGELPV